MIIVQLNDERGGLDGISFMLFLFISLGQSRSTAALQGYERHLKDKGEVTVDLFLFSENHELDVDKLTDKLNQSAVSSQVSVLLLLTGAASYLWLDPDHNPKNVDLCTMLKHRFPQKLNFVICPTSGDTRKAWESDAPQLQNEFFDGSNLSVWDGFDRDVASTSPVLSLKLDKSSKDLVQPKKDKSTQWSAGSAMAVVVVPGLCVLCLLYKKLWDALEAEQKQRLDVIEKLEKLEKVVAALQEGLEKLTSDSSGLPQRGQWLQSFLQAMRGPIVTNVAEIAKKAFKVLHGETQPVAVSYRCCYDWFKQSGGHIRFPLKMAVTVSEPKPPKPTNMDVEVLDDKSLVIRWEGAEEGCYLLEISYYRFGDPMIKPEHSDEKKVQALAAHVPHPAALSKACAWTVKVQLRTKSEESGLLSEKVMKRITWDDELSMDVTKSNLKDLVDGMEKRELKSFLEAKQKPTFLIVGGQHHGKSSFANHLHRCSQCDLSLPDPLDVAPAGQAEKTVDTKQLPVRFNGSNVSFIDTPAFSNMSEEAAGKLSTLCSTGIQDGRRRDELPQDERSWFWNPPHGAIVVMSLCHWRDQTDEMQSYLAKMAEAFKNASGGKVAFPYVVACTHRDVFLRDCQKTDPAFEVKKAVEAIQKAALTEHVYSVNSYKKDGLGSARNNKATFDLLSQLLTKAKHENTARVQQENCSWILWKMSYLIVVVLAMVVYYVFVWKDSASAA
eukprot:Skav224755  [mRNA]  locus=scaffold4210:25644:28742:- [translate_table: standard]